MNGLFTHGPFLYTNLSFPHTIRLWKLCLFCLKNTAIFIFNEKNHGRLFYVNMLDFRVYFYEYYKIWQIFSPLFLSATSKCHRDSKWCMQASYIIEKKVTIVCMSLPSLFASWWNIIQWCRFLNHKLTFVKVLTRKLLSFLHWNKISCHIESNSLQ